MKCFSVKQPWAYLLLNGLKDVENRSRPLPDSMVGQRVLVHTGKQRDRDVVRWTEDFGLPPATALVLTSNKLPTGALVGELTLTSCVEDSDSPWFFGPYGWLVQDPYVYPEPIPYKGQLGFFDVPDDVLVAARG